MSPINLSDYKQLYFETATEYVAEIKKNIPLLLTSDAGKAVEILHRSAHSLKSQSLIMGYTATGNFMLLLEHIFRAMKENRLACSEEIKKYLESIGEKLQADLESIKQSGNEVLFTEEQKTLETLTGISSNSV